MSTPAEAMKAAMRALEPTLGQPMLARYRVVRTELDRLSLQRVDPKDGTPDMIPIEVWPGVPGATSVPTLGEIVIVAFVGDAQYPAVLGRAPKDEAGSVPVSLLLDAKTSLGLITRGESSGAKVTIGSAPVSVTKYAGVASLYSALVAFSTALQGSADPTTAAAATVLSAALTGITIAPTMKLEAT